MKRPADIGRIEDIIKHLELGKRASTLSTAEGAKVSSENMPDVAQKAIDLLKQNGAERIAQEPMSSNEYWIKEPIVTELVAYFLANNASEAEMHSFVESIKPYVDLLLNDPDLVFVDNEQPFNLLTDKQRAELMRSISGEVVQRARPILDADESKKNSVSARKIRTKTFSMLSDLRISESTQTVAQIQLEAEDEQNRENSDNDYSQSTSRYDRMQQAFDQKLSDFFKLQNVDYKYFDQLSALRRKRDDLMKSTNRNKYDALKEIDAATQAVWDAVRKLPEPGTE